MKHFIIGTLRALFTAVIAEVFILAFKACGVETSATPEGIMAFCALAAIYQYQSRQEAK